MKKYALKQVILLALIGVTSTAQASPAAFSFNGPHQFAEPDGFQPAALENEKFERNDYEAIGATLDIYTDILSPPEAGDSWLISLDRRNDGQRLGQIKIHYDATRDCYMVGPTAVVCGIRENSDELGELFHASISAFFFARCIDTEDYDMPLEYQLAGGALTPSYKSPFRFSPTRFRPRLETATVPANLEPKRYRNQDGQAGEISAFYVDDLDCGQPVEGAEVTLTASVLGGTNGQAYLVSGDRGTGTFSSLGYDAEVDDSAEFQGTRIKGYTDENGVFKAEYQAQDHGAEERITFDVRLLEIEDEPEYIGEPEERDITLSIPGLVQISEANGHLAFRDAGSCPHSPLPHWLTPTTRSRIISLAAQYYYITGRYLSLNDASLPLGGMIANQGGGGRDAACHKSHRYGIDIDLNGTDRHPDGREGVSMHSTYIEVDGDKITLLRRLTSLAKNLGGTKVLEEPIHYRFE